MYIKEEKSRSIKVVNFHKNSRESIENIFNFLEINKDLFFKNSNISQISDKFSKNDFFKSNYLSKIYKKTLYQIKDKNITLTCWKENNIYFLGTIKIEKKLTEEEFKSFILKFKNSSIINLVKLNDLLNSKINNLKIKSYILNLFFSKKELELIDIKFEKDYKQVDWIDICISSNLMNYGIFNSQLISSGIFSNIKHFKNIAKNFWNIDEIDFFGLNIDKGIKINIKDQTCDCWFFKEYKDKLNLESDLDFYEKYDTNLAELILY